MDMMITAEPVTEGGNDDAALVARSLAGGRDAFQTIVFRYQSLVCSIAYSATGSLSESEDLAQETFLAAWKHLGDLREPAKLRAWLCGVVRNLSQSAIRRQGREPTRDAEPLERLPETAASLPLPSEQAVSRQEEAILWRSLERIPEPYREPLVLFYREHRSVERVAEGLELSEEVVRQRLSRGRKLLQEQVLAFIEGALERSAPGPTFTIAVVAAVPVLAGSTATAAVAASTAKAGVAAKSAASVGLVNLFLHPGALVGLLGGYFGARAGLDSARSPAERQRVISQTRILVAGSVVFTAALCSLVLSGRFWAGHHLLAALAGVALPLGFAGWLSLVVVRFTRQPRRTDPPFEYRSRVTLLGIPLLHVVYGSPAGAPPPAVGWIAVGERAVGILFALGLVSVGGVSVGVVSVGLVSVGTASAGLVSMGAATIGLLAVGGAALGLVATGGLAVGWAGATGGLAIAHGFARGAVAIAEHANDPAAADFFARHHPAPAVFLLLFALAVLAPACGAWRARRSLGRGDR